MKKIVRTTTTRVPRRLRQVSYENQHHLTLHKRRKACPDCGDVTTSYYVECIDFDLMLYISKEEFKQLSLEEFKHWPVETMYEKFDENGKMLRKGELFFSKKWFVGKSGPEIMTVVSKIEDGKFTDLFLADDRFQDLQGVLDYDLDNFYIDFSSGLYPTKVEK